MGKFTEYTNMFSANLEELNNQAIRRAVAQGFKSLLASTKMDSGQAAYLWQLVSEGSGVGRKPSGPLSFRRVRGQPPVGKRGDRGAGRRAIEQVKRGEIESFLKQRVSGRTPDTKFYFLNPIFDASLDKYVDNAELRQALKDAAEVTMEYYQRLMTRFMNSNGTSWGVRKTMVNVDV